MAAVIAFVLCGWQLRRDGERNATRASALAAEGAPPLGPTEAVGPHVQWRVVDWSGQYAGTPELFAQRLEKERRGYGLVQRFVRDDGVEVWVDRGWIDSDAARALGTSSPGPEGPTRLTGQLRPMTGAADAEPVTGHGGVRIWPYGAYASLAAAHPAMPASYVVSGRLDGSRGADPVGLDGFATPPRDQTSLHYASQWLAIGLLALIAAIPGLWPRVRSFLDAG